MKFHLPVAVFTLLLGATDATYIEKLRVTGPGVVVSGSTTLFGNDGKSNIFHGYFSDGCRSGHWDWMRETCIDSNRQRAHVIYTSGLRRCFKEIQPQSEICGGDEACWGGVCTRCWTYRYNEVKCT
ncbi:hypothetical protein S7711_09279 [Stachybotrys chartarum IBT 7711]|uniref:SRCR domain-containing protein n=1 Tax=Stachybotrys chartarum (strain CBS 109288 / IBT 7711) TaxID=1280523 RepID=A0A084AW87_STACB|nr:hypothetical protein S7711_09279 [Stachybotrys chartarum IBT 7711]